MGADVHDETQNDEEVGALNLLFLEHGLVALRGAPTALLTAGVVVPTALAHQEKLSGLALTLFVLGSAAAAFALIRHASLVYKAAWGKGELVVPANLLPKLVAPTAISAVLVSFGLAAAFLV